MSSTRTDVTDFAVKAIRLLEEIHSKSEFVTKLHCLDVFRGANIKAVREKGHHTLSLFGVGSPLHREEGERLFDQLIAIEVFRMQSVRNQMGWCTMYLQVSLVTQDSFGFGH